MRPVWVTVTLAIAGCSGLSSDSSVNKRAVRCAETESSPTANETATAIAALGEGGPLVVDFANPVHRAALTEDGLRYVRTHAPYAIYEVTSASPRIHIPGTVQPDLLDWHHWSAVCVGAVFFSGVDNAETTRVSLFGYRGGSDVAERIGWYAMGSVPYDACSFPGDRRQGLSGTEPITGLYLELSPAPPIGSLVPLRMIAVGLDDWRTHEPIPGICCPENDPCDYTNEPPGWSPPEPPEGSPPDGGAPEPPDGNPPDGGTPEPPTGNPPDGGTLEPPATSTPPRSEPPGVSPPCPPGFIASE